MNSFIRIKLSTLQSSHRVCLVFFFLHKKNYNTLSKYTIALASRGTNHYNGRIDLLFLLLKLSSLQKIIFMFIQKIYLHNSEVL